MPFNQGMVGLKAGPVEGDIGKAPAHLRRARLRGDGTSANRAAIGAKSCCM